MSLARFVPAPAGLLPPGLVAPGFLARCFRVLGVLVPCVFLQGLVPRRGGPGAAARRAAVTARRGLVTGLGVAGRGGGAPGRGGGAPGPVPRGPRELKAPGSPRGPAWPG